MGGAVVGGDGTRRGGGDGLGRCSSVTFVNGRIYSVALGKYQSIPSAGISRCVAEYGGDAQEVDFWYRV